jgi:hypothetical protein
VTWSTETFAQNPNANAIRWGTLYDFRFDSTSAPAAANATVGFLKTGQPITVAIQAPSGSCAPFTMASAVSRKTHGTAGTFDIPLPGVECRTGGASGDHTIVVSFSNSVVSGNASVTAGTGSISGSPTFSGNTMTISLTGVTDVQQITVTLNGVTDSFSQTLPDTAITMKALWGDSNGNSTVSSTDVAMVKSQANSTVGSTNFRADLTADGVVNTTDIAVVKAMTGDSIP